VPVKGVGVQVPPPTRLAYAAQVRGGREGGLAGRVHQVESETLVDAGPLRRRGFAEDAGESEAIDEAVEVPPQTTRARLRGEFIRRAKERTRDYTVDWAHLKLNDQAQRTVPCKDPFRSHDERVDRLIASL
jgi:hypothetical protein